MRYELTNQGKLFATVIGKNKRRLECIGGDCRPEWNWRRADCPVHGDRKEPKERVK